MKLQRTLWLRSAILAVVAALGVTVAPAKADIVSIDDFSTPTGFGVYAIGSVNPYVVTAAISPNITRTVTLTVTSPSVPQANSMTGNIGGGAFTMSLNNSSAGTALLHYAFASAINLTPGTDAQFLKFSGSADAGFASSVPISVQLHTHSATSLTDVVMTYNGVLPNSPNLTAVPIALSDFTGGTPGNLNFVTALDITITAGQAADISFDALEASPAPPTNTVPAPAAAILALMVVPAAGLRRALRKTA